MKTFSIRIYHLKRRKTEIERHREWKEGEKERERETINHYEL